MKHMLIFQRYLNVAWVGDVALLVVIKPKLVFDVLSILTGRFGDFNHPSVVTS